MQNSDTRSTCFSFDADRLAESAGRCRPTSPPGPSRVSPNSVAHPGLPRPPQVGTRPCRTAASSGRRLDVRRWAKF